MTHKLKHGKYAGKTLEWIFFHAPWYAKTLAYEEVNDAQLNAEENAYFQELHRRAYHIEMPCTNCHAPESEMMGLRWAGGDGELVAVHFYCTYCCSQKNKHTELCRPSFFVDEHALSKTKQLMVINFIRRGAKLSGDLTQAMMEEFFQNDAHFVNPTPGFFANQTPPQPAPE